MNGWQDKANRLIAAYCLESYRSANILPNGKRRRSRHVPYSVPEIAQALVNAIGTNDEHEAKRLFHVESIGAWTLI